MYDETVPHEVKLFDTRILFLATALNVPLRNVVKNELNGDEHLAKMLEDLSTKFDTKETTTYKVISINQSIAVPCHRCSSL